MVGLTNDTDKAFGEIDYFQRKINMTSHCPCPYPPGPQKSMLALI